MMRYLGLDVGERRIGVAVTDPLGWTVQPVATVDRTRLETDLDAIAGYIQDYSVGTVLIGMPLRTEHGTRDRQATKIATFAQQLRAFCSGRGLTPEFCEWDESMTTHDAHALLKAQGVKGKRRLEVIDQAAAVVLLQSFLAAQSEQDNG
jgi:putative holliday junction resolvase